ncbi:magnesium transporter CorA family protein [Listeria fleischmannii]|jgi:magnesium transporter|uniref:Magnesium transporter CorA family protein n=1 Tax=Listeria fleischmannii TaxID=1069827 RepID=A0A841YDQ5_9LIST|nr:magnesium transporter CorA family protein [Listeria fleischmannii]EIA20947.1 magnesium transporter CorA family protein [Listeria fleischmannii subsp. coloradonensis]MBC1398401.1 magnesium transporter CorA family protein [Listeria fleischmannii]MBC1426462.1 magnesium transporter CorA family protein [Listeria fleischmannii]STY35734.1 Magnesium transport protein CorA [Listeria fleischmannii subsp. coloradonensis]
MIEVFSTDKKHTMKKLQDVQDGCWIKITSPTQTEIEDISNRFHIPKHYFHDALDEEERSRIELKRGDADKSHSLVIVDCPYETIDEMGYTMYETMPIGIILVENVFITISLREVPVLTAIIEKPLDTYDTSLHTRFLLQILYAVSYFYLNYLNKLIRLMNTLEGKIKQSMKNEQLYAFMAIQKSLVFFATALQSNKAILDKMQDVEHFMQNEANHDLLRDVVIENKQAIAMTDTYTQIISGMSDIFSSVISNNLNMVMKFLTSFTIILSLPTIVGSIYGMNVSLPFAHEAHAFSGIMIFTIILTLIVTVIFWRKKYF